MVIGIIPDASKTETLLNNLSEADFALSSVSVVMQDINTRNKIAKDDGPLKKVTAANLASRLTQLGLAAADAQPFTDAVNKGQVLVAVAASKESQDAAAEMLHDASATLVKTIP